MRTLQILGPGCAKCTALAQNVEAAARELGLDCDVTKVTDINEIIAFGVMMTPALVVDGTVKTVGSVPSVEEVKALLS